MNRARAASAGTWLLEHAGVDDALAGDLAEQFARDRSAVWYWRQVALAILLLWMDAIADHKWLAARAVLTGWVLWALFFVLRRTLEGAAPGGQWVPAACAAIRYGNWLVIGWTIGLLHRPHHGPMVLAYVLFTLLMSIPAVSRLVVSALGHPNYHPPSAAMVALAVVSLVAGGLLSAASARTLQRAGSDRSSQSAIG